MSNRRTGNSTSPSKSLPVASSSRVRLDSSPTHGKRSGPRHGQHHHKIDVSLSSGAVADSGESLSSLAPSFFPMTANDHTERELDGRLSRYLTESRRTSISGSNTVDSTARRNRRHRSLVSRSNPSMNDFGSLLSEEFDLAQEDARVMQDVQRALQLKARRESRGGSMQVSTNSSDISPRAKRLSSPSAESSSPARISFPESLDHALHPKPVALSTDVDFSPAVHLVPSHPVPALAANGRMLDWSGSSVEEGRSDRLWKIPTVKKKEKEAPPPTQIVEKEIAHHADKLREIKSNVSYQTLRKADITKNQLERRYALLSHTNLQISRHSFNLLQAVRWYNSQQEDVKSSLIAEEPLTWIKHVLDKRKGGASGYPGHVSAYILEEYYRHISPSDNYLTSMETIPEMSASDSDHPRRRSPSPSSPASHKSTRFSPSGRSYVPTFARHRSSGDHVSFKPFIEPQSSRSSPEVNHELYRVSTASPRTSIHSDFSPTTGHSPTGSRLHLNRLLSRRKLQEDSDGGTSKSMSDNSSFRGVRDERDLVPAHLPQSRPANLELESPEAALKDGEDIHSHNMPLRMEDEPQAAAELVTRRPSLLPLDGERTAKPTPDVPEVPSSSLASRRRQHRISLPSVYRDMTDGEHNKQKDEDNEKEKVEYEKKTQMLDDLIAQNKRTRQLLNNIASGIRDIAGLQSKLSAYGVTQNQFIDPELLEMFKHDPSAVTGDTRKHSGWRAVEEIHSRITRQREVFHRHMHTSCGLNINICSILEDPVLKLTDILDNIDSAQAGIAVKTENVAKALATTKTVQNRVKTNYNETLSHTSVIYPELSQIVALEESYKNQYQQFWDFAMDAATFFLDIVAPFWRRHGKPIGQDFRDFIIVPLYRNEFTGGSERYPITQLPRRSLRHWFCILALNGIVYLSCWKLLWLAILSTSYYRIPWIEDPGLWWFILPFFWIFVITQWITFLISVVLAILQTLTLAWWAGWTLGLCS